MDLIPNLDQLTDEQKVKALESIQESIQQSKEIQKKKIAENVDLVLQALKKIESDIRTRFDGVGNAIEKRVASIKDGRDGINGVDGRDGKDGKPGRDGQIGPKGRDGLNGRDGIDGQNGVSVTNAHLDFDGSLVITLSNGTEIDVGEVMPMDLAEKIKIVSNGGGTSQYVVDTLASLQTQIDGIGGGGGGGISSVASADGSVTVTTVSGAVDLSVAVSASTTNVVVQVRNATGATLTKGTLVYISGATGQIPTVSKALATSDATSAQTLGMMTADLTNNTNGYVTIVGLITEIDTSAFADGAQLYLSGTTAGTYTSTKTYAPTHLVYVGVVEYSHAIHGKIFVKVQNGYELDEIHNVSAQSPTTGQTIVYNSSTSLWEKNTVSLTAGVNGTLPVANGGTGVTTSTGSGNNVLSTSPTLVTPILGTPTSVTLTNATGLPISTGVSGLGTGVATALAVNTGVSGAFLVNGGALGTPSSGILTNATGYTTANLSGTISNAQLANSTISGVALGGNLYSLTAGTNITFSSGTTYNGSSAITISASSSGISTGKAIAMSIVFGG